MNGCWSEKLSRRKQKRRRIRIVCLTYAWLRPLFGAAEGRARTVLEPEREEHAGVSQEETHNLRRTGAGTRVLLTPHVANTEGGRANKDQMSCTHIVWKPGFLIQP